MAITSIYARPQVGPLVHVRREGEVGRYLNSNLPTLMWLERLLQRDDDRELHVYQDMKREFLYRDLYH